MPVIGLAALRWALGAEMPCSTQFVCKKGRATGNNGRYGDITNPVTDRKCGNHYLGMLERVLPNPDCWAGVRIERYGDGKEKSGPICL